MEAFQQDLMDKEKNRVVHRRKWLTLEEKLRIIHSNEKGKGSSRIARELGMNESSVRSILRKKDFYKSLGTSKSLHTLKSFARGRSFVLDEMEKQLTAWIEDNNRKRIQLTETGIQKKALALFNELRSEGGCTEKFSASRGWFYRFKNRINLQNCIVSGKKPPPDSVAVEDFQSEFTELVTDGGYSHQQIFSVEETSFYWKKIPSQSLLLKDEKNLQGHKPSNDPVTLFLGCNAAGDLKLKPLLVYRSETPSTLWDCDKDSLPVIWRSSKNACLSEELFLEWFTNHFCSTVENYCRTNRLPFKILLLLNSGRRHDALTHLKDNIKIVYLPQNTASFLQPMTLGIFSLLKANYLRKILSQAISSNANMPLQEFWSNYNIRKAVDKIHECWQETSSENLAASWHHLLGGIKVKDFRAQVEEIIQEVVAKGQLLGIKAMDAGKVHSFTESALVECNCSVVELEEVMCKEEPQNMFEDEHGELEHELSLLELEKILGSVDFACETISARDPNVERSIKVRQMLQNGIQAYRDLYLAKSRQNK